LVVRKDWRLGESFDSFPHGWSPRQPIDIIVYIPFL
jgi:hypothetical protein